MTSRILILFACMFLYYLLLPEFAMPIVQACVYAAGAIAVYVGGYHLLGIKSDSHEMMMGYFRKINRRNSEG